MNNSEKINENGGVARNATVKEGVTKEKELKLNYLDKDFVYDCMSVPSHSGKEFRMITFIILWARRNNVKYEFDDYGNIYLTKGELNEGEFYPCLTSHLDTVQDKQDPYIMAGVPLDLKTEITKDGEHKVSVDTNGGSSIGIGADDKSGVCISLTLFGKVDKLKACFFLEEEKGCLGSKQLNKEWFNDVGYVIGYDSPDLYRAAWSCSGVKLFSYDFYEKHMKTVCDKWGLVKGCFFSEPFTDVVEIRKQTKIICMNFGNGGYNAHGATEYIILEHMDYACGMGLELIQTIGCTQHILDDTSTARGGRTNWTYHKTADGVYEQDVVDDVKMLEDLGDNKRYGCYGGYGNNSSSTTTTTTLKKEDEVKLETVKYIVERYEKHITAISAELTDSIKEVCNANNIDFALFETVIKDKFSNEITF